MKTQAFNLIRASCALLLFAGSLLNPLTATGRDAVDGAPTILSFYNATSGAAASVTIYAGGTVSGNNTQLAVTGDWTNHGTFVPGNGAVFFNGSENQHYTRTGTGSFNDLIVDNSGGDLILNHDVLITGLLSLPAGDVNLNGRTIDLSTSGTLSETPGNTVKGTSGTITAQRTNPSGNVAGLGATLSTSVDLGLTTITRGHAVHAINNGQSILRYYDIEPTSNSGLDATLEYAYDESERNSQAEASLQLFRSTDGGATWTAEGGVVDAAANVVTLSSIDAFSRWTLSGGTPPLCPVIKPVPASPTVTPGQSFIVDIIVGDDNCPVTDLFGLGLQLHFDANRLQVNEDGTYGSLLATGNPSHLVSFFDRDNTNGISFLSVVRKRTAGLGGVTGHGVAFTMTFTVAPNASPGVVSLLLDEILAVRPDRSQITLHPEAGSVEVEVCTANCPVLVWPGDHNNDGTANFTDFFYVPQNVGLTGPTRPDSSLEWIGQEAALWPDSAATYVDSYSDGIINQNDVIAIGLNWGLTHAERIAKRARDQEVVRLAALQDEPLSELMVGPYEEGKEFTIEVHAGSAEQPLTGGLGVGAELTIPTRYLRFARVYPTTLVDNGDLIPFKYEEEQNDTLMLSVAFSRKRGSDPIEGHGAVMVLELTTAETMPEAATVALINALLGPVAGPPTALKMPALALNNEEDPGTLPSRYALERNYPNPFNPATTIEYALPRAGPVRLAVYDLLGREVAVLVEGPQPAGIFRVQFDARSLASGLYLYRLDTEGGTITKKMLLLK